ncbi:NADPH2:quinone reductase [Quadrisphaera granulorum]|uniref:NADPH2:quinone reductase n=1 Tax=Quadrisphaera granulorum TaxID=317664 RepID=A0A316AEC3_9ACTN|nr:NADPH:quinone reductase [Quadrisphaera granulorum]PWJ55709.1 NADPH2:quinone reductase [Quadrisphaera granulorum]SZE95206.1 NADPH2:quinone reductase [Quadrisphaera granulorum]
MRAVVYERAGGPEVLQLVEREVPEPGPGEVRVRVAVSGVNPTDWKVRATAAPAAGWQIPHQDGAGVVDAVGQGVDAALVGRRVWIWEAAFGRPWGTAAELVLVPVAHVVPLPDHTSFQLGASLGIPFLTAHRCLTLGESAPSRIGPGTFEGRTVLVQGGAGAVGNAAVQLASWAGARVLTTVSGPEKAQLAAAAGAHDVIDYRREDVAARVREVAPRGVDVVVEVSGVNAGLDSAVLAPHGTVALYAGTPGESITIPLRDQMTLNGQWHFVLVYTAPRAAKAAAVEDVEAAVAAGAVRIGREAGLPLTVLPLAETAQAQAAVEGGAVGKVLVDVTA